MKTRLPAATMAAVLSLLAIGPARAGGDTDEDVARAQAAAWAAPLTLSADGLWRLHVDGHGVLHRASLADPTRQRVASLPAAARMLSASRSGQKVAFTTSTGCIGLTDFGAAATAEPRTTWLPVIPSGAWSDVPPAGCVDGQFPGRSPDHAVVALSADGRLLATRGEVVDTVTHQLVATLPPEDEAWSTGIVLALRFVDRDSKLLVLAGTFGAADEAVGRPSDLRLAVWDLATHSLYSLASHENALLGTPHALFADFSPQTGVFTWVDSRRPRDVLAASAQEAAKPPRHDLVQSRPGRCAAPPVVRSALSADSVGDVVVDPWGRWMAELQPLDDAKPGTPVARLVVSDMDSRRVVASTPLAQAIRGLVATPDGATILALSPASDVLSFKVDLAALATPKASASAWEAMPCRIDDEAPDARAVARVTRALAPAWTMEHAGPTNPGIEPFVMRDGSLWLDLGTTIAQLDLANGKTLRALPTPRSDEVASVPVPASGGFFNWQGDTLSWRPFDAGARRRVDVRPGWTVEEVGPVGRSVRVVWQADDGTRVARKTFGVGPDRVDVPQNVVVAFYDAASGRRVREFPEGSDEYGVVGDVSTPEWSSDWLGRCRDVQGALAAGIDWRFDALGSLRATRCEPDGARTTVAWFGLAVAPRVVAARVDDSADRPTSVDGGLAAALDDRQVRAFDIESRRELGQVTLRPTQRVTWLRVLAGRHLLLIETSDDDSPTGLPRLGAWSLK